jgi:hypothetical protein
VDEVNRLIELNRIQRISFEGVLDEESFTNWIISGIPVIIQADTKFVGEVKGTELFVNGSVVEVEGITNSQRGVTANEIHLGQYLFTGIVEKIDKNSWQISGIKLSITPRTKIEEGINVGDEVRVLTRSEDNGLYALSIQNTNTPVSTPLIDPALQSNQTEIEDPTAHHDIETFDGIATTEAEHSLDGNETSHEEPEVTAEPTVDSESEDRSAVELNDSQETVNHDEGVSVFPEMIETPQPTDAHERTP